MMTTTRTTLLAIILIFVALVGCKSASNSASNSTAPQSNTVPSKPVEVTEDVKAPDAPMDEDSDKVKLENLKAQIKEAAFPGCGDDGECDAIAIGTKPCGGPWYYLPYSVKMADMTRLQTLVLEHNQLEELMNKKYGYNSDCMYVTKPKVTCVNGRCTVPKGNAE